jgi:hypothetical protein
MESAQNEAHVKVVIGVDHEYTNITVGLLTIKLVIFVEISSVLNTWFMDLFNLTLAVNVIASSVFTFLILQFIYFVQHFYQKCTSIYESKLARQYASRTHEEQKIKPNFETSFPQ